MSLPFITAEEAASYIHNGDTVAMSGFTASGSPKVVPVALAKKAKQLHDKGEEFKINLYTGASTNDFVDGELSRANAIGIRTPYQGTHDARSAANNGEMEYYDSHLSMMSQDLRYGFLGDIDVAVIEVTEMNPSGEVVLGAGIGMTPVFARLAKKIILEYSSYYQTSFRGLHDNYIPLDPPRRREIPIYKPSDRIGSPLLKIDPSKIIGVVPSNDSESIGAFTSLSDTTKAIGANVADFLAHEIKKGRLPKEFLPVQSGVGNIANAALYGLADHSGIPPFEMYTEVVQDAVMELMEKGKCTFASTCAMAFSDDAMLEFMDKIDFFREKLIMRPVEISNHPEVVRRLGLIAINTALESDIYGNVNSTHANSSKVINGVGGSAEFSRNAYLSIFLCPSSQKNGALSTIVPMVTHTDHSEHSVKVIVTEHGVADLRNLCPTKRAEVIIDNCVHPDYRPLLRDYLKTTKRQHIPHNLKNVFAMHTAFEETGDMRNARFR